MEKQSQKPNSVFSHFDTFNIICSFLTLKDKLTMSSVSKLNAFFLQEHFSHLLNQGVYDKSSDKTMRQLIKYNFNRNLKVVKIPSILAGQKQQSTYFNFFKFKCITRIEAEGKHFVAFIDNKNQAYIGRASEFIPAKYKQNIRYDILKNVQRVFCKAEKVFILNLDGSVTTATLAENPQIVLENHQLIEWTLRVPVLSMSVSKNYGIFLLGTIKSSEIKKLILGEEIQVEKGEENETMKIIAYNTQTSEQYIINYPYKQVKSYCVGSNSAYFINQNYQLIHCVLTNLNEGQTELTASVYPFLQNKRIIAIYGGLHYFIALNREQNLLEDWKNEHVIEWLKKEGFDDYVNIMRVEKVDGKKLVTMEKKYMENVLGITNVNLQQKMFLSIEQHMKITYNKDRLFGWGKNETGQLANNMAVFINKPVNIKLPELNKNENIVDIKCGWYNTVLITNENRVFVTTQELKKDEKNEKQEEISDQQLKEMEKERKRKKTDPEDENNGGKKDKKKKGTIDQKQIEKQKQKYEEEPHWIQYKCPSGCFALGTTKDILLIIQLAYKQQEAKKKIRTVKAVLDKIEWDPNLNKSEYKIGYLDKYMGLLDVTVDEYLKSEIKEHRIAYFKRNGQIVWHKEDKIDLI